MIDGSHFTFTLMRPDERFAHSLVQEELDLRLLREPGFPAEAWRAPVASWVLARIVSELDESIASQLPTEQVCDGGGYFFPLVVTDATGAEVGEFQLQGNTFGVALLGSCGVEELADSIITDFITVLLRSPEQVALFSMSVRDPEWEFEPDEFDPRPTSETMNRYGWNGDVLLGADNIWSEFDSGQPRPSDYKHYLKTCLARMDG